jgi:hypothetical protein
MSSPVTSPEAIAESHEDKDSKDIKDLEKVNPSIEDASIDEAKPDDILALQDTDPALNAKMYIVNNVSCSHLLVL